MYLIISPTGYRIRQSEEVRTDSHFLAWLYDTHAQVFRFNRDTWKFERMVVTTKERQGSKHMFFTHHWVEVILEEEEK